MRHQLISRLVVLAALLQFTACGDSTDSPISPTPVGGLSVDAIAASASVGDSQGLLRSGAAPAPSGGPRITAAGNQTVVNGGTLAVTIDGDAAFTTVYMFVGARTLGLIGEAAGGISGHYEVRLPSPQTSATMLVAFPQSVPIAEFELQFAAASAAGAVGPYVPLSVVVTEVGTGDVQVTLSWDADSDVDLHVVGPGGDEVYYGRRRGTTGGELDLDSNAGCDIDGIRNENITWPVGQAPRGQYIVRVDYWSSCGVSRTNYTVRINNGGSVQIVTGSFTGAGDQGGLGSGQTVATFERTTGPSALTIGALSLGASPGVTKTMIKPGSGR